LDAYWHTCFEGTAFIGGAYLATVNWTKEAIHSAIRGNFSPPLVPEDEWEQTVTDLIDSYPFDEPSFGSPYNTGNDTFGLSQGYKIMSAISEMALIPLRSLELTTTPFVAGDLTFTGQHRLWAKQYASAGSKWFGYLLTQPQPQNPGYLGGAYMLVSPLSVSRLNARKILVTHGSDHPYFFGGYNESSTSDVKLAEIMRDYWISFVVSQDPNDDFGTESAF